MYVEAICPLCLHCHIVPADLRGERYRCDECEEIFVINRRSKRTDKKPPRPRSTVRPADEPEAEVLSADAPEVLPSAAGPSTKRRRKVHDDRAHPARPRRRRAPVMLIVGLSAGLVLLIGLGGFGAWWYYSGRGEWSPSKSAGHSTDPNDRPVAHGQPVVEADPPKKAPQKPKNEPPKPEPGATWTVKADPPAAPVSLPADFSKEIAARSINTEVVFPTSSASACVVVGDNFDDKDERHVWNLQTNTMIGKVVGRRFSDSPPVLGPDGAHLAILPFGEREIVDVAIVAQEKDKPVRIDTGLPTTIVDFAGPGKLMVAGKRDKGMRVRIWDATTGKRERDFDGPTLGAQVPLQRDMVAISPRGAYLAVVTPEDLWIWDLTTGSAAGRRALPWNAANWLLPCRGLSFSPDGRELAGLFEVNGQSRLVCWNLARGGEPVFDVTFPGLQVRPSTLLTYTGHVLGWVGERRGWLLYGQMFIDRTANKVGPAPAGLLAADPPFRCLVGPDHLATLPGGLGGRKVLTVSRFDPEKP
jgi:hypothetical protein